MQVTFSGDLTELKQLLVDMFKSKASQPTQTEPANEIRQAMVKYQVGLADKEGVPYVNNRFGPYVG